MKKDDASKVAKHLLGRDDVARVVLEKNQKLDSDQSAASLGLLRLSKSREKLEKLIEEADRE